MLKLKICNILFKPHQGKVKVLTKLKMCTIFFVALSHILIYDPLGSTIFI